MDINFELYKIFYHAAKHESFSEAAKRLFITQSAISQAMKSLEEKIGSQLFFRKARKLKLTAEGELLFRHVEQAYNFIKTAENKMLEAQNLNSGEIRIGASDTVCKHHLIPYIERFYNQYPRVKIQVVNRTSHSIAESLRNGTIDFGIVTLPTQDTNISVQDFMSVEDIFVACNKFFELKNRKVALKDLSRYPLLMLPKNSATRRNIDKFLEEKEIRLMPEIELEDIDLLVEFARIGLGIAHVLKDSAQHFIEKAELFQVQTSEKLPLRKLGIISMENVPLSKASAEFISLLREKKI